MKLFFATLFTFTILPYFTFSQQQKTPSLGVGHQNSQHFGLLAGMWLPTGSLDILGNHPSIGLQWGFRAGPHEFDITLDVRFLRSRNEYEVFRNDSYYPLKDYIGGYIGVDYVHYIISQARADIGVLIGAGYDGFSLARDRIPARPYEIGSFNFNAGIRFNIYSNGETYFSLLPRYNFINYGNNGGTSFKGNAISIDLFVGGLWEIR